MARVLKERNYANKTMTQSMYKSYIMSGLRQKLRFYPPCLACRKESSVGRKTNSKTGRMAMHFKCAECGDDFTDKFMQVDHIETVTPITGFVSWDDIIERMFIEKDGLQLLCKTCHSVKSKAENALRREHKKANK